MAADEILLQKGETIGLYSWHGEGIWALSISGYDGLCDYLVADDLREIARRLLEVADGKGQGENKGQPEASG